VKDTPKASHVKHTIKDSVFTNLFQDKKYLIQLYKALHPEDTDVREEELTNITIKNILTDNIYNDLGFLVGDRLIILTEAQSTWSVNIIIRGLVYLMQSYQNYFEDSGQNLYKSKRVKLPKPELYVIYTGDRLNRPEYISLTEEFFEGQDCSVDAKVKILYDGEENDIIHQYVVFTKVYNEQRAIHGRSREAVLETIRICKDRDILKEYLVSREKEVVNIMFALFDDEWIMRNYIADERREAAEEAAKKVAEEAKEAAKKAAEEAKEAAKKAAEEAELNASMRTFVETCQEYGETEAGTIAKVIAKFQLTEKDSKALVKKYWK
jgi:hypothetical protein